MRGHGRVLAHTPLTLTEARSALLGHNSQNAGKLNPLDQRPASARLKYRGYKQVKMMVWAFSRGCFVQTAIFQHKAPTASCPQTCSGKEALCFCLQGKPCSFALWLTGL